LDRALAAGVVTSLLETYDSVHGGLGFHSEAPDRPKFPVPAKLALLQFAASRHGNEKAEKALYHTLDELAAGGIRDHMGGGFHRYSTDRFWHVPHFEKMLYDQAQLADVFIEAYRRTNHLHYREAAEGIFEFVAHDLTDARGGFYSALDAETDGVEGRYYVWSPEQIEQVLGADDAPLFQKAYGFAEPRRFEHGYVLHLPKSLEETAKEAGIPALALRQRLEGMRQLVLLERRGRKPVLRDDKVLTGWNAMMIRALARAGTALGRDEYHARAEKAAMFLLTESRDQQGRLHRTWRGGEAKLNAYLDDYAFLVEGLLALYDAKRDEKWLNAARRLTDDQLELFWDEKGDAFFFTPHHHEELIARTKNARDAVHPSGNSVSIRNLIRLASLTGDPKYRDRAERTLKVFAPAMQRSPSGSANLAIALSEFLDDPDYGAARSSKRDGDGKSADPFPAKSSGVALAAALEQVDAKPTIVQVGGEKKKKRKHKISARAHLSVDRLPAGSTCRIAVIIDVDEGWHINTNPAQPKNLKPTVLTLKSKNGVKLTRVNYPTGKSVKVPGLNTEQTYYEGRIALFGDVRLPAEIPGNAETIELLIEYQPCNDRTCLRKQTLTLKGNNIPVAPQGEKVRQINRKLFAKRLRK
jgi:hypothetical protein